MKNWSNIDYSYNDWIPYGAAQLYCIDFYLDDNFEGNAVEQLLSEGATFEEISPVIAVLRFHNLEAVYIKSSQPPYDVV